MSRKKEEEAKQEELQQELSRVMMPRNNQTFGVLEQRLGGSRNKVRCFDGKTRVCRIPGRLKRKLWVREGDLVLIEPWELSGDGKGDVIFKYKKSQIDYLQRKGLLKQMQEFDEF
jgi:translation initiation factor 1A